MHSVAKLYELFAILLNGRLEDFVLCVGPNSAFQENTNHVVVDVYVLVVVVVIIVVLIVVVVE